MDTDGLVDTDGSVLGWMDEDLLGLCWMDRETGQYWAGKRDWWLRPNCRTWEVAPSLNLIPNLSRANGFCVFPEGFIVINLYFLSYLSIVNNGIYFHT